MYQHYLHLRISLTTTIYKRPTPVLRYHHLPTPVHHFLNAPPDIVSNVFNVQDFIEYARHIHARDLESSTISSASSISDSTHTQPWNRDYDPVPIVPYTRNLYRDIAREMPDMFSLPSEPPSLVSIPSTHHTDTTSSTTVIESLSSSHPHFTSDDTDSLPSLVNRQQSTISSDDTTHDSISTVYDNDYQQQFWVDTTDMTTSSSTPSIDETQPTPEIHIAERPTSINPSAALDIPTLLQDFEEIAEKRDRLRQQILHRTETDPVLLPSLSTISRQYIRHQFDTLDILHDNLYDLCHQPHATWSNINHHVDLMVSHQRILLATINDLLYDVDRLYPSINMFHVTSRIGKILSLK